MAVTISSSYLRNSYQIIAKITADNMTDNEAFDCASDIIYAWAKHKFLKIFSHMPYWKASYNDARDGNEIGILYEPNNSLFILRCAHPDNRIPARRWITDTEIRKSKEGYIFAVRLSVSSLRTCTEKVPYSCPSFVKKIIKKIGISDTIPIDGQVHTLSSREQVDDFMFFLENKSRRMPIVLITPCYIKDDGSYNGYMMNAHQIASDLLGVAHIFEITNSANEYFTETVGKQWSAFNGTVRTYYPNLVFDDVNYYMHPLITRSSILIRNLLDSDGPNTCMLEIEDYIKNFVVAQHLNFNESDIQFYLAAYQNYLQEKRNTNEEPQIRQTALIDSYELQIQQLKEQCDEYAALAESYSSDCDNLKEILEQRNQFIRNLKAHISDLEFRITQSGQGQLSVPTNGEYSDIESWVQQYFPDKITLHPRAIRSLKEAIYEDKALVYKCLILLATEYYQYRSGYINYEQFTQACKQVDPALDERAAITDTAAGQQGEDYFVTYRGRRRKIERHLAKGSNKDRRYCLRIYYFWDDEDQTVVICDLPHHLDTSAT